MSVSEIELSRDSGAPLRDVRGKVAFITGGSSGIGLGIARACSLAGMKVVITYLTEAHLDDARGYFENADHYLAIRVDVRDRTALQAAANEALAKFGEVNMVCANAGVGITSTISAATLDDWDYAIQTNIMGVVNTIGAFLPAALLGTGPSHFVATSSMSGLFHGGTAGLYTSSKYAVVGVMEALRAELSPRGIGVSVCCPGMVRSRIFDQHRNRCANEMSQSNAVAAGDDRRRSLERWMSAGMDPLECGERILCGVRRNDMYILTHPEYAEGLRERFVAIMESFATIDGLQPPARVAAERNVLRNRVYAEEIERLRSGRSMSDSKA